MILEVQKQLAARSLEHQVDLVGHLLLAKPAIAIHHCLIVKKPAESPAESPPGYFIN